MLQNEKGYFMNFKINTHTLDKILFIRYYNYWNELILNKEPL